MESGNEAAEVVICRGISIVFEAGGIEPPAIFRARHKALEAPDTICTAQVYSRVPIVAVERARLCWRSRGS